MKRLFGYCAVISSLASTSVAFAEPQLLGKFKTNKPAFLHLVGDEAEKELVVSSFGMFGGDAVSRVRLTRDGLSDVSAIKTEVLAQLSWPNEVTAVPEAVFGSDFIAVGTGFLVPGRSTGAVAVINTKTAEQFQLSNARSGYFYHRVVWHDMNGDGRLDVVTARARKGLMSGGTGEILWLENPAESTRGPWTEHVIAEGPDVNFVIVEGLDLSSPVIIATEFFSKKLSVLWREGQTWSKRVLDDQLGSAFDLELADLNGDGRKDVVVTNHEGGSKGAVFAYEIPKAYRADAWPRHTLLGGIKVVGGGFNAAAPGSALVWQQSEQGKPEIFIGGDGSFKVHHLVPTSADPSDWTYEERIIHSGRSTIGRLAIGDADGSGRDTLFVPSYDDNQIYVFRLN